MSFFCKEQHDLKIEERVQETLLILFDKYSMSGLLIFTLSSEACHHLRAHYTAEPTPRLFVAFGCGNRIHAVCKLSSTERIHLSKSKAPSPPEALSVALPHSLSGSEESGGAKLPL